MTKPENEAPERITTEPCSKCGCDGTIEGKLRAPNQGWRRIEDAPKMRKLIVGYWNPLGHWRTILAQYWNEGELEGDTDTGFAPEGWYESTEAYEELMPVDQQPEMWQLPPAPPVREGDE